MNDNGKSVLEHHYDFICRLTNSRPFREGDLMRFVRIILKESSEVFEVQRLGLWWFNEEKDTLRLELGYDTVAKSFHKGQFIHIQDYPEYFKAVKRSRNVVAEDVYHSAATQELINSYCRPYNIGSLLDTAVRVGGKTIGILCLEHVGGVRKWSIADINLAGVLCDLISNTYNLKTSIEAEKLYRSSAQQLKESNITLNNVLEKIEEEKRSVHETITHNIEARVKPLLAQLKGHTDSQVRNMVVQLENSVDNLTSEFFRNMVNYNTMLTPMEIKVSELVRGGLRAKEIAEILNLSSSTVETHKKNIRKKLNLTNKSVNLKTYLDMLSQGRR